MSVWDKKNNSKGVGRSVFFVNTIHPRIPWEDSLMEELSWSGLPTGMFVWDYLEYLNWCGKTQPESGWYRFPGSGLWTVSERREGSTKAVLFTVDMRSWSRFLPWRRYNDGHLNCDLKATLPPRVVSSNRKGTRAGAVLPRFTTQLVAGADKLKLLFLNLFFVSVPIFMCLPPEFGFPRRPKMVPESLELEL